LKEKKKNPRFPRLSGNSASGGGESAEMRSAGEEWARASGGEAGLTWIWKYTATELQNARLAAASIASAAASIAAIAAAASPPLAPRRGAGRSS
jgi:hypothetical protein